MKAPQAKKVNNELSKIPTYHDSIPFKTIKEIVERVGNTTVLDSDGTRLDGVVFCGRQGRASFNLKDSKQCLHLTWYKMDSGRYEIVKCVA
jgi:hypothetical protein